MKFDFSTFKKRFILLGLLLCMAPSLVFAQSITKPLNLKNYDDNLYHFGFILAYNQMSYSFNYKRNYQFTPHYASEYPNTADVNYDPYATYYVRTLDSKPQPGFTVGVVGNLRLGEFFDLRLIPSLSFGTRTINYNIYKESTKSNDFVISKSILSTFMEFPLQVKYRSRRLNNIAAYIIAGANFKVDLASQKKSKIDVVGPDGNQISVIDNIRVKRTDIAAEIGAGFDFYNSHFKFGIEVKMGFGLFNIMDPQKLIYDSSIVNMRNKTFQVSFTFE